MLSAFILAFLLTLVASAEHPLNQYSTSQLEQQIEAIDQELTGLARISLRTGSGSIGYRSRDYPDPKHEEWLQIDLSQDTAIDQIVLVPSVWRDPTGGFKADGFPESFRVIAGTKGEKSGTMVASFNPSDKILPRIAPLIIPCNVTAAWVRVECDQLALRGYDGKYNLEFSELFIFSGEKNVALHQPVSHGGEKSRSIAHRGEFLVDGFTPYFMNTGRGNTSRPFIASSHDQLSITVDLGAATAIDRLHLHAAELNDTAPQGLPSSHGIPRRLQIEAANTADFSDATLLATDKRKFRYQAGPILMIPLPETVCRYVRILIIEPYLLERGERGAVSRTGFAELELFSQGKNVALHRSIQLENAGYINQPATTLTDGLNLYGRTLSIRQWMNELARRHDLETERPFITTELNHRYARQQINLRRLGWLSALLAAGILITILVDRLLRMRHIARIKERFAADLHDELGANLHTITLLGELAEKKASDPEKVTSLLQRIQATSKRSVVAVHHVSDLQTATGLYTGLVADMKRAADRVVVVLNHNLSVEGEDLIPNLNQQTQFDLFLFYKECLINCCRHSDATEISTHLVVDSKHLALTLTDNGSSSQDESPLVLPPSLQRRAKILGAKASPSRTAEGGWCIALSMPNRRRWPRLNPDKK